MDNTKTMTKADLVEMLFIRQGMNKREAKLMVDAFFDEIRVALESGRTVKLSGFGNFQLRDPRMDLKPNPLYEDSEIAYFKTHYYGGIKKYQWVTVPLALHGVVCRKDGTVVTVTIGEDDSDPVLMVSDLLIHLSAD